MLEELMNEAYEKMIKAEKKMKETKGAEQQDWANDIARQVIEEWRVKYESLQ